MNLGTLVQLKEKFGTTHSGWNPKVYPTDSPEHKRLEECAKHLTEALKEKGITLSVKKTWFDFGQGWAWTTLIARDGKDKYGWQALSPAEQELLLVVKEEQLSEIEQAIADYYINEWCW